MDKEIESILKFDHFTVDNIVFESNHKYFSSHKGGIQLEFDVKGGVKIAQNKKSAETTLTCTLFENKFEKHDAPFYLKIKMTGYFSMTPDQVRNMDNFQINTTAILFPYLRAAVSNITSTCEIPTVKLPPINTYALFKNNKINRTEIENA